MLDACALTLDAMQNNLLVCNELRRLLCWEWRQCCCVLTSVSAAVLMQCPGHSSRALTVLLSPFAHI